ncbi:MAG TPA: TIGR00282 family metallophosphoesterase [Nitrospirae bacterium]|nr:TIGR00282 family metallophosphoesterase [Nitrospirota bacterium]
MKILAIGDVFGKVGRRVLKIGLNNIISSIKADFVIANGENLAGGFGVTQEMVDELFSTGVDVITSGNHIWDKKEALKLLDFEKRLLRPANYPEDAPGRGSDVFTTKTGALIGVLNVQGRVFMDSIDCPFRTAEKNIERLRSRTKMIIVDMHAEATSEKIAMGYFLDGRVSAIVGTHTHVQTSDAKILPRQTAYITDLGMTGPSHSIIGVRPEIILKRFLLKLPERFNEALGPGQFNGAFIELDDETGMAKSIRPLQSSYEF